MRLIILATCLSCSPSITDEEIVRRAMLAESAAQEVRDERAAKIEAERKAAAEKAMAEEFARLEAEMKRLQKELEKQQKELEKQEELKRLRDELDAKRCVHLKAQERIYERWTKNGDREARAAYVANHRDWSDEQNARALSGKLEVGDSFRMVGVAFGKGEIIGLPEELEDGSLAHWCIYTDRDILLDIDFSFLKQVILSGPDATPRRKPSFSLAELEKAFAAHRYKKMMRKYIDSDRNSRRTTDELEARWRKNKDDVYALAILVRRARR